MTEGVLVEPPAAGKETPPPRLQRDWPRRLASDRPWWGGPQFGASGWTQRLSVIQGSESAWRGETGELVHLDPEAPPCSGRILERETNRETNQEPGLSIRNKAGKGTWSQARGHGDRCSLEGSRPDPATDRARVAPVLIYRFTSREIRRKKKISPLSSLLCHNLSVPNFEKCASFSESIIQSHALLALKVSNAAGIVRQTPLRSPDSERKTQCHIRLWGQPDTRTSQVP